MKHMKSYYKLTISDSNYAMQESRVTETRTKFDAFPNNIRKYESPQSESTNHNPKTELKVTQKSKLMTSIMNIIVPKESFILSQNYIRERFMLT